MIIGPFGPPSMYSGLCVNVAYDGPVKVQVTHQIGRVARRERRIDIVAVARKLLFFCVTLTCALARAKKPHSANTRIATMKIERIVPPRSCFPPSFYNSTPTVCQGFTRHSAAQK
jgi:hypothetical protein